jgi:hypothetical protein
MAFLIILSTIVLNGRRLVDVLLNKHILDTVLVSRLRSAPLGNTVDILSSSFFFFGGLSIPLSQAILAYLFSYNMTWGATKKEVEQSNFFKEVPKIMKRCVTFSIHGALEPEYTYYRPAFGSPSLFLWSSSPA